MNEPSPAPVDPATLRRLARLVTVLTLVMILGMITIVGLMVVRLQGVTPLPLPENLTLPRGLSADAVTVTAQDVLVLSGKSLFLYDRQSGQLLREVEIGTEGN